MSGCIGAYPPISQDAIDQTRKFKAVWKIRIKDYTLYNTGVRDAAAFILAVVYDMWVRKLRNPTTFYTEVLPSAFLKYLKEDFTGFRSIDDVNLPLIIQGYYADSSSMPVYVNMIKESQRKLLSTNIPFSSATLLVTATKSVFALQEYSDESCEWECDPKDDKTWAAWKLR